MKSSFNLSLVIFLSVLVTACDPPHSINFINTTNSPAKVIFEMDPTIESSGISDLAVGDSIVVSLAPSKTSNIFFGIGTWSDGEIENELKSFRRIRFETRDNIIIYKTRESMIELLKTHRKGWFLKTEIDIELKPPSD